MNNGPSPSPLVEKGKGEVTFTMKSLPAEAQFSPVYGISINDYDGDGKQDILIGGNFYQSKPEVGIYDASYGLLLKGDGKGNFVAVKMQQSGFFIKGAVRDILSIKRGKRQLIVVAKNNDTTGIFSIN